MRTASAAIKLAIFAICTAAATGLLAMTIGNVRFNDTASYHAIFSDVSGLQSGDGVRVAGVRVGQVEDTRVVGHDKAEVTFSVVRSRPLSTSTRAFVRYKNLVGQRYLALQEGPGGGQTLAHGGTIPVANTHPALDLTVLFNGFRPLFKALSPKQVNKLAYEIIKVLQGESGTVNSLLAQTASLTNTLADRDHVIGELIDNLNAVLATLDKRDTKLSQLILQLQRFVSGLAADRHAIGASLENINELTITTADLLHDARPSLKGDIHQLGRLSKNLDKPKNKKIVNDYLRRLPHKVNEINRSASYGSWFNFYLCSLDAMVSLGGGKPIRTPEVHNETARCNP
ncbi:MAG: MCE family protein [Streptosporangiaceae bacterium]